MARRDGMMVRPLASAEIVAVGTEILLGSLVDTNTAWLSQRLVNSGVALYRHNDVGDDRGRLSSRPFRRPPPGRTSCSPPADWDRPSTTSPMRHWGKRRATRWSS